MEWENTKLKTDIKGLERKLKNYENIEKIKWDQAEKERAKMEPIILRVNEDRNLIEGIFGILHYIREALTEFAFEVYVRSTKYAYERE